MIAYMFLFCTFFHHFYWLQRFSNVKICALCSTPHTLTQTHAPVFLSHFQTLLSCSSVFSFGNSLFYDVYQNLRVFLSFFIGSHTTFIRLIFLLACYPLITPLFSFFTPVTPSLIRYAYFFPILFLPLSHTLILCLLKDLPPYFPFILSLYPCTSQHYPPFSTLVLLYWTRERINGYIGTENLPPLQ